MSEHNLQNNLEHQPQHKTEQEHEAQPTKKLIPVAIALVLILALYGCLAWQGLPQKWTEMANTTHHDSEHDTTEQQPNEHHQALSSQQLSTSTQESQNFHETNLDHGNSEKAEAPHHPPYIMVAPFAILLLSIAFLPLHPVAARFWESNTNKFLVAFGLGVITLLYYFFACNFPVELHWPGHAVIEPSSGGFQFQIAKAVFINAILNEFIPFIVLLFSLFTITGGIRIEGDLKASPFINSIILLIGAVLASFVGTTGAAMLLIRLLLETNKQRKYKVHTVIMFIFCVCNCGGCLTPLGDPPLFLGYLRGIAFSWTLFALWPAWLFVNLILIGFYFLWDTVWYYPKEPQENKLADLQEQTALKITGYLLNIPLLVGVVCAVMFLDPGKAIPGTDWHPWSYLREAVQLGLAALSLFLGSREIRFKNAFNFLAIGEVAALFFGIFICMQAPLQILNYEGKNIVARVEQQTGIEKTKLFFWATGTLSSVLDNAPTYVVFFETARSLSPDSVEELQNDPEWREQYDNGQLVAVGKNGFIDYHLLVAVALGAVFMGSMTYIGNGPNFMVKAIAEQSGVKMPSFLGYMVYSCLILLPLLIIMTLLFL
ncbi:MAG: sodium:proton antiporter [Planctomycetaceae bacterium]|jgi:Na+/H+ antiporter NhaD/arsenite permease-like protein|nr:sodium:proton antiporter [Planctomycetaceae bacterium]